jgi:hypothetical protein
MVVGLTVLLCVSLFVHGQQSVATANVTVPPLIQFSNVATDEGGNTLNGVVNITFSLYSGQLGGEPLWTETQNNIQLDSTGHYSVQLGITKPNGVPATLFTTGEARWLGVRVAEQPEQPRVLLLSVPYALKAGDAATVGGLPPSAFVLATPGTASAASTPTAFVASAAPADTPAGTDVTGSGTADFIPLWTTTSNIADSVLFQSGSGSTAKIGVNTTTPASTLDVKGGGTIRGTLNLPAISTATATKGSNSQPMTLAASAFNSTSSTAVNQTFQWQTEPTGNDTSTPSGTLNLLFGEGTTKPSETGLYIASDGQITFASGQTFPGAGTGTVTSVASGAGLTGGPITGSGTLSIATGGVSNTMLANPSLTVTAGTDLTGGGLIALGGTTTLNVDTTKVPQLNAANTFTGNQTVSGNLTATGVVSGSSFEIGSSLFVYGSAASQNAFFGLAGNSTMTGLGNTATGFLALASNTTPTGNTAYGAYALFSNTTGSGNSASGYQALEQNTTGVDNTAHGYQALAINTTGYYNTASGWQSLFSNTTGNYNTATGGSALYVNTTGYFNTGTGGFALAANTTGYSNTGDGEEALDANTTGVQNTASGVSALWSNTTGSNNTTAGFQSLFLNISGSGNTADGYEALYNSASCCNVAVGNLALQFVSTGQANTGVGNNAGATVDSTYVTGNNNTTLGTGTKLGTGTLTNATALGANAEVDASNSLVLGSINGVNGQSATTKVGIGTTTPSNVFTIASGAGKAIADGWTTYSSRRWKTNVQPLHNALGKVEQLRGVSYDLKESGKHEIGVIAEEVGAVVPEVVTYEENGKDARGVDYSRLTALLIEAAKEQQRDLRQQQTELSKALSQIRSLKAEVRQTREALRKVKAQVAATQPALWQPPLVAAK